MKLTRSPIIVLFLISAMLTACTGQPTTAEADPQVQEWLELYPEARQDVSMGMIPLTLAATLRGLLNCLAGNPGTAIYVNSLQTQWAFVFPYGNSYAFMYLNDKAQPLVNYFTTAGKADALTATATLQMMIQAGWKKITAERLPAQLLSLLRNTPAFFAQFGVRMVTPFLLLLPVGPDGLIVPSYMMEVES